MRIRSGGPHSTRGASGASETKGVSKTSGAKFTGMVEGTKDSTEDQARKLRTAMMQELESLAKELEAGKATKEEASRRFVGMVIRDRFGKQGGKGAKFMEDSIGDLVEADPAFVARLHNQLKKLAKS